MNLLRLSCLVITISILVTGCQKNVPEQIETATIITGEYKLMTPAYYRESEDASAIEVRFYESPRIIALSKSHPDYTSIRSLIDDHRATSTPMRVYLNTDDLHLSIDHAEKASRDEISTMQAIEFDVPEAYQKKVIPNMAALDSIFDFCAAQGCATGTAIIDYCIPFQYVVDGCYARAHKMRQIMLERFNISCEKVFSYEGDHGSLAVDAGDCCVNWWYHVAPLVTVKVAGGGYEKYVIDPSMFSEPVSIDTWTAAQETVPCPGPTEFGYYEITPGKIYTPGGGTDNSYSSTNWTLQFYADLVTCP